MDDTTDFNSILGSLYDPTVVNGVSSPSVAATMDSPSNNTGTVNNLLTAFSGLVTNAASAYNATQTAGTQQAQAGAAATGALATATAALTSNKTLLTVVIVAIVGFAALLFFRRK